MTFKKRAQNFHPNHASLPRSVWLKICFSQSAALLTSWKWRVISMEILRLFLRSNFVGKKMVASRNSAVFSGYCVKFFKKQRSKMNKQNRQNAKPRKRNVTHRFSLHVTYQVLFSAICLCVLNLNSTRGISRKIVLLLIFKLPAHAHGWADDAITRQNLIKIIANY